MRKPSATPTIVLAWMLCAVVPIAAGDGLHVMRSEAPATKWEEALVTGNGRLGAMVFGGTAEERVVFNHERLYEPLYAEVMAPPKVAAVLPEVRRLLLAGNPDEARRVFAEAAREAGFDELRWTDPYHPAMAMRISEGEAGQPDVYTRGVDFRTGEVTVLWRDEAGVHERQTFVSRPHNVVVQRLKLHGGAAARLAVRLVNQDRRPEAEQAESYHPPEVHSQADRLIYRCKYRNGGRGYVAVTRVVPVGGEVRVASEGVHFEGDELLLLTRVVSVEKVEAMQQEEDRAWRELAELPADYERLLAPHAAEHGEAYDRVTLDLGGGELRGASSEALLAMQMQSERGVEPALLEKMFNMGRYSLLSSSGEWPPNLMGVFNGDWRPRWSGDFTLDANVNLQIAPASIAALPEATDSYARLLEGLVKDWRVNARNLYGCRGLLSGCRTDGRHNLHTHHELGKFPGFFWTAGAAWLVAPLVEHYEVTGDREFARERLLPLLKGIAQFYEDFLVERDADGKLIFVPSYSPENEPSNTRNPVTINATMDIACAKEVLTSLASLCRELGVEPETAARCDRLREQMPPYLVNRKGALKEWAWPTLEDRYNHRHVSHLYPVWPGREINPDETPTLFEAARVAAQKRGRGNGSAHGLAHMALLGARLKDAELVGGNLRYMLRGGYVLPSLFTYHNPDAIYNADMLHSLPAVVIESLVFSKPGEIELLPALPPSLPKGELRGARCRCRAALDRLAWDLDAGFVEADITSAVDQTITLRVRRAVDEPARKLDLVAGRTVTVRVRLAD
ncbi:hypothetical protein MalM25_20710 [Planctomycetes bacterium MalM25]|nr:hypothetical protein MalM25_20710 [Planctomycetes bacterium MalM25]